MADFEQHLERLEALDAQVIATSSDGLDDAKATVDELGLEFTVGFGLDPEEATDKTGCYTADRKGDRHVQPTAFVLKRDGTIALAVCSSGKVGRLTAQDAIAALKDLDEAS